MTRVAAIQMVSSADVDTNLQTADSLINQAVANRSELLVLPENFPFMGMQEQDKLSIAEPFGNGPVQTFLAESAARHKVWIIGGTIPLVATDRNKIRSASLLFNPDGQCLTRYDKIHLFDVSVEERNEVYCESGTIEAGDSVVVAETPLGNIGMSVCYDLRFPELYRSMHVHNVNIIVVPSAFTHTTGMAHWETLLRARAIENLCYVIAPNQGGQHINNRDTWGHSMIVDPWGQVLRAMEKGEGIVSADIDIAALTRTRQNFPALEHGRININR